MASGSLNLQKICKKSASHFRLHCFFLPLRRSARSKQMFNSFSHSKPGFCYCGGFQIRAEFGVMIWRQSLSRATGGPTHLRRHIYAIALTTAQLVFADLPLTSPPTAAAEGPQKAVHY
jgi:hypothetical protein